MKTLIQEIQEKYYFIALEPIKLVGYSSTIVLDRYILEIEETDNIEPLRIEIKECHEKNKPIKNFFRLSIVNFTENDIPYDLFTFRTFDKLDRFLTAILE
jgi:hypothetical protein